MTTSRAVVDQLAQRYGKLPTEILDLSLSDFYLNVCIAFPEFITKSHDRAERRAREELLGYNPIKKLLAHFREVKNHGE
jgi:hypothetical protein